MLGKRVIKFERLKITSILRADKTGFCRLGHNCVYFAWEDQRGSVFFPQSTVKV